MSRERNRRSEQVYSLVPGLLQGILDQYQEVSGFVLGGSYAAGKYNPGDDIDMDILYENYPTRQWEIYHSVMNTFEGNGLIAHIRGNFAKSSMSDHFRKQQYARHPNSPHVLRNLQVAKDWGLKSK